MNGMMVNEKIAYVIIRTFDPVFVMREDAVSKVYRGDRRDYIIHYPSSLAV